MRTLVIADKNFSSWSLRPWLVLKQADLPFREIGIRLRRPDTPAEIRRYSPSGRVPCLIDGHLVVWDSLAICETLAEQFPALWPDDPLLRAEARAISAEMHSGFTGLRQHLPMDIATYDPARGQAPEAAADIARIVALWESCRSRFAARGSFLFGAFSIADAMYAPVVWRFVSYGVALPPAAADWRDTLLALPAMQEWRAGALAEVDAAR